MVEMKALLLTAALTLATNSPALGQSGSPSGGGLPEGMYGNQAMFQLVCAGGIQRLSNWLANEFFETPVAMGDLSATSRYVIFTNADSSSISIVVHKVSGGFEEACIIWAGNASPGGGFILNESPVWPEPKKEEGPKGSGPEVES